MSVFKTEQDVIALIQRYGRENVISATAFVFRVIIQQIYVSGFELPYAFDEIDEWLDSVELPYAEETWPRVNWLSVKIVEHCLRETTVNQEFWLTVSRAVNTITTIRCRSRAAYSIGEYLYFALNKLAELFNVLNQQQMYKPEGYARVHNILLDHLQGKI